MYRLVLLQLVGNLLGSVGSLVLSSVNGIASSISSSVGSISSLVLSSVNSGTSSIGSSVNSLTDFLLGSVGYELSEASLQVLGNINVAFRFSGTSM